MTHISTYGLYCLDARSSIVRNISSMQARVPNSTIESWEDPNHRSIPSDVYHWRTTFQDVDKDVKRVCANAPKIAYFFPHPSLFVNGELNERRERYFRTWLVL